MGRGAEGRRGFQGAGRARTRASSWALGIAGSLVLTCCGAGDAAFEALASSPEQTGAPGGAAPGSAAPSAAASAEADGEFLRFVEGEDGRARLDTAILRYRDPEGRVVDIVGAVHIGDPSYYSTLNQIFRGYDSVLYEMVKPSGESPASEDRADRGRMSWIGMMQKAMKDTLELQFQLDGVDYSAPNFVHADLDLETFLALQDEAGENIFLVLMNAMAKMAEDDPSILREQSANELSLVFAMFSKNRSSKLKYALGRQFGDLERMAAGIEDADSGKESVLVGKRNAACIRVLEERLAAGDDRLAIFYGSAHIPDLERRLAALQFERVRRQWVTAWNIVP